MKANSRQNKLRARRKAFIFVGIISFCAIVLVYSPTRGIISRITYRGAPFMFKTGSMVRISLEDFWGSFRAKSALLEENASLREDMDRMQAQILDRNLLQEKVQMLEEILGRGGSDNRVIASVISAPWQSPYDTLVIDSGEDVGIHTGDLVVYAGAGVIGRVAEVYSSAAKIMLFSSPQQTELAVLIGASKLPARARGRGMGNFEAFVPWGSAVSLGSDVVLAEDPTTILGVVGSIEKKETMPFIRILFNAPFNITSIRHVEVITNNNHHSVAQR